MVRIDIWCHERGENVEKHKFKKFSTNSKILVIRDMFLTPNANAYERSMLLTPDINVYERRKYVIDTEYQCLSYERSMLLTPNINVYERRKYVIDTEYQCL